MKYTLRVSYDCGMSYSTEMESDNLEKLKERGKELDKEMLRWGIDNEEGKPIESCAIHKSIISAVLAHRLKESQNER